MAGSLGDLTIDLNANIAKFTAAMDAAQLKSERTAAAIKSALIGVGAGIAGGLSIAAIKGFVDGVVESTAALKEFGEKAGTSAEQMSQFAGVAKMSGLGMDGLNDGLIKLSKGLAGSESDTGNTSRALKALGLSAKDAAGNLRDPTEVMKDIAYKLIDFKDGAGKTALAMDAFGKSGANMLPFLKDLAEAGDLEVKVTNEQAAAADDYEKGIKRLSATKQAMMKNVVLASIPVMNDFVQALLESQKSADGLSKSVKDMAKDGTIKEWAQSAALSIAFVVDAFDGVVRSAQIVGKTMGAAVAQAMLVAQGEFKLASQAGRELGSDIDRILSKKLFSDSLKQQFAKSAAAGPEPDKKVLNYSNKDIKDVKLADDPALKLMAGQIAAQDALIAAEKAQLATRDQYAKHFYELQYTDAKDYYATKQQLIQDALAAEMAAYDKESEAVATFRAQATKEVQVQEAINKQRDIDAKRTAAQVEASKQLTNTVLDQTKAYRQFDLATTEVMRKNALNNDQMRFAIDLMGKNTLEAERLTAVRQIELDLQERIYQMRNQNLPQEQIDRATTEAEAQKTRATDLITQKYEKQRSATFGMGEAMRKYGEDAGNMAAQIENSFTSAFKGMEDSMVNFVKTGKLDFSSLADSIITDLIRIQIKQSIMQPLNAGIQSMGGLGGLFGAAKGLLGFANGGDPPVGVPSIVGENGPELFVPKAAGTIIPNGGMSGSASVTIQQPITINAPGATADTVALIKASFAPLLAQNKDLIVGAVQQAMRRGGGRLAA